MTTPKTSRRSPRENQPRHTTPHHHSARLPRRPPLLLTLLLPLFYRCYSTTASPSYPFLSVQSFRFWFRTYTLAGQPTVSRKWFVQPYPPLSNSLIFCSLHTTRNTFYELSKHSRRRVAKVFACVTSLNKHYASGSASKIYKKNGMNKKHVVVLNTQTHGLPQEADKTGSKIKTLL